jgi:hypothetical protein
MVVFRKRYGYILCALSGLLKLSLRRGLIASNLFYVIMNVSVLD